MQPFKCNAMMPNDVAVQESWSITSFWLVAMRFFGGLLILMIERFFEDISIKN